MRPMTVAYSGSCSSPCKLVYKWASGKAGKGETDGPGVTILVSPNKRLYHDGLSGLGDGDER